VTFHPDDETWAGLVIERAEGRLFFADVVRRSKLGETLERGRIVSSLETAVQQFLRLEIPDRRPA
jgi:hypothetical protein